MPGTHIDTGSNFVGNDLRIVTANQDGPVDARIPGSDPAPDASPLQRIQIVKGWLDTMGELQETVYDIAGDPQSGAWVDTETCTTHGQGFTELCAVWSDPTFDPAQRAFYYARVLQNPTCRWHTYVCNALGVSCDQPDTLDPQTANCCNTTYPRSIQERAWTSPVFLFTVNRKSAQ